MRKARTKKLDELLDRSYYRDFIRYADKDNYVAAYFTFSSNPDLVWHMPLYEIPVHYAAILSQLGKKETECFKLQVASILEDSLKGGSTLTSILNYMDKKKTIIQKN